MSYVTKAEVVAHLISIDPTLVEAEITDIMLDSAAEMIDNYANTQFTLSNEQEIYVDGNDSYCVFSPVTPIASLTSVTIIAKDLTETLLDFAGSDRNAWYDPQTGKIEIITVQYDQPIEITGGDLNQGLKFYKGVNNVKLVGDFGRSTPAIVKLLQIMLIAKQLALMNPKDFKMDVLEEKIGRYSYRRGVPSSQAEKNQYVGLDGYINFLFESLPKDDELSLDAI